MNVEFLIVDDDPISLMLNERYLSFFLGNSPKVSVNSYLSPKDALEFVSKNEKVFREKKLIILLDLNMPEINGFEFVDILNKQFLDHQFFIYIISSSVYSLHKEICLSKPKVIDYFVKPFSKNHFELMKKFLKNEKLV
ncbi:response regulator [Algoriphagus algorifonticola]|uniref:response regulator n=1 Tax=Algoriphagus algorifonticola TaxID=2593007 RepID=UPI0011AA3AD0|nr:response regulator [Algoriphagus algorifonticola]